MIRTDPHNSESAERPVSGPVRTAALAGAAGLGLAALTGCNTLREQAANVVGSVDVNFGPIPRSPQAEQARRILGRVAYGPQPGDVTRVAQMGAKNYIEEQLADTMPESKLMQWRLNGLEVFEMAESAPDNLDAMPDEQLLREIQQAALLRAVYSTHQLREVLADFWTNHLNLFAIKANERVLIPTDTEYVIRPHILGKFREMLIASAHSPAMLVYLDNQENKRGIANENYARELLELHTLGVRSGYTQQDIHEVARCFTGWHIRNRPDPITLNLSMLKRAFTPEGRWNGFRYDPSQHDDGAKFIPFLNLHIAPNGGKKDADTILEQLAVHPTTARFLATKLCKRFLGYAPEPIVQQAAQAYRKHDTDIREMLKPILLDGLFASAYSRPILARPMEYVVASLRALGADTDGGEAIQKHLFDMGQPLYQWPMPDGFPEKPSAWTGSLLPRWNYAFSLASNTVGNTRINLGLPLKAANATTDAQRIDALLEATLNRAVGTPALQSLRNQVQQHVAKGRKANVPEERLLAEATGLLLSSPDFQWR